MFILYLNAALFARLVTAGPVLVDVGVNETFEGIQLAQDSQQFFTGDDTVKQWLLRFAYIPSQGHEPNWSENTTEIQVESVVAARELIVGRFATSAGQHGIRLGRIGRQLGSRNGVGVESAHSATVGRSEGRVRLLVLEVAGRRVQMAGRVDNERRSG